MVAGPEDSKAILLDKLKEFWRQTGYVTDTRRVNRIRNYLKDAEKHIEKNQTTDGFDAYYRAKREWRLARKSRQLYFRRDLRGMRFALLTVASFLLGLLIVWDFREFIGNVYLPLLSVLGGGIGGGSAVLIRAIDVEPNSEVVSYWTWYVIKTGLGAALGLVTYFALVTGLSLFSESATIAKPEGAVVIGFLAGFFETFSTGVLARVAAQLTKREAKKETEPTAGEEE